MAKKIRKNAIRKIRKILEETKEAYTFCLYNNFSGEEVTITPKIIEEWFEEITSGLGKLRYYESESCYHLSFHSNLWFRLYGGSKI